MSSNCLWIKVRSVIHFELVDVAIWKSGKRISKMS